MALAFAMVVTASVWTRAEGPSLANTVGAREPVDPEPQPRWWVDTHAHPFTTPGSDAGDCLDSECLTNVLTALDNRHVQHAFLLPMPSGNSAAAENDLPAAAATAPDRYSFLMGGMSLNPKIQGTADGRVTEQMRSMFAARADEIASLGAVGYGEFAALHFAMNADHIFEEVPPDHPLFLLLAEKSAEHGLPIDLHMEAALTDKEVPAYIQGLNPDENPSTVQANIGALRTLLDHDPAAKIVWVHVGWDNTGDMTVTLLRGLLNRHPNLYLQIEISDQPEAYFVEHAVLDSDGTIRPEWLDLLLDFPNRFVLGSDAFYKRPDIFDAHMGTLDAFVQQLPPEIADLIARENALAIYPAAAPDPEP